MDDRFKLAKSIATPDHACVLHDMMQTINRIFNIRVDQVSWESETIRTLRYCFGDNHAGEIDRHWRQYRKGDYTPRYRRRY